VNVNDLDLMVERVSHSGHYVISAMVVDHDDYEFRYAVQFWGYEHDEVDQMKEAFMSYVNDNGYVLS
jgi:endonuclease III-like uncharacterized protein